MRRKFHITGKGRDEAIRIADADGRIVCTLPWDERRLARFIVWAANVLGVMLGRYDRQDWLRDRGAWNA